MTNREAVNWLINITADIGKAEHRDLWHYEQALSEIREMLEAQTEHEKAQLSKEDTTKDTISRQAAIDALDCISGVEEVLRSLPTIQPERAKGEWSDGYRWQRCSLCKQTGRKSWNYCPNYGADMRGEKDERTD